MSYKSLLKTGYKQLLVSKKDAITWNKIVNDPINKTSKGDEIRETYRKLSRKNHLNATGLEMYVINRHWNNMSNMYLQQVVHSVPMKKCGYHSSL